MAERDLGEARVARKRAKRNFMRGIAIAMHQHDRDCTQPLRACGGQSCLGLCHIERAHLLALRRMASVDLENLRAGRFGAHDLAREQIGALLRADRQRIAEPARDREQHRFALALEQGIGRNGCAHPDFAAWQRAARGAG